MRFHHLGIPTNEPKAGEHHVADLKLFVTSVEDHPYRIQWMRFEPGSPMPELLQTAPHLAFEVDDLQMAIAGKEIVLGPDTAPNGTRHAIILDADALIEFIQPPETP